MFTFALEKNRLRIYFGILVIYTGTIGWRNNHIAFRTPCQIRFYFTPKFIWYYRRNSTFFSSDILGFCIYIILWPLTTIWIEFFQNYTNSQSQAQISVVKKWRTAASVHTAYWSGLEETVNAANMRNTVVILARFCAQGFGCCRLKIVYTGFYNFVYINK